MKANVSGVISCGCTVILLNIVLGGYTLAYCVKLLTGQTISLGWATLIGLFTGEITIPLAFILYLLKLAGVHFH
jgi:hypothetical protein